MGGICGGSAKNPNDQRVQQLMREAERDDSKVMKLLFLGAGGSGKSTLFKQLKIIHGDSDNGSRLPGLTDDELISYISTIYSNVITGMKTLIEGIEFLEDSDIPNYTDEELKTQGDGILDESSSQDLRNKVVLIRDDDKLNDENAEIIKTLWSKDLKIKAAWEKRGFLQVQDTVEYFIQNIDRISEPSYKPTVADVLRVRSRTTGIVEQRFMINGHPFLVVDVGGQRNERKKWLHAFDNVTAVIYVAALSAYNQTLFENDEVNRMHESLDLFGKLLKMDTFTKVDIILFLNKSDIFAEKIEKYPLNMDGCAFPEYDGPHDMENSYKFIRSKFEGKNPNPKERQLFIHMTTATDTKLIERIFNDVQRIIIDKALRQINLL